MTPDDPRHGTIAGASAHQKDGTQLCADCLRAKTKYTEGRRLSLLRGQPLTISAIGTARRIQALVAMGWCYRYISSQLECTDHTAVMRWAKGDTPTVRRDSAAAVARLFNRLALIGPPETNRHERRAATQARRIAQRSGWVTALAWDDIDNDQAPLGMRSAHSNRDYDGRDIVDEATVLRILAGEVLPTNNAEKREVMRRWLAAGKSERSLTERMNWKDGRYVTRDDESAA